MPHEIRTIPAQIFKAYLGKREPRARYTSFDYCFNYFQSQREQGRLLELLRGNALQLSCLHLGFYYLASRGMLRGWSELLQGSVAVRQVELGEAARDFVVQPPELVEAE